MTRVPALPDDRPAADPSVLGLTAPAVRVRFAIAYDGTDFSGWAVQPGRRTVQGELETALARIVREPVRLTVAGRTDAGVHARGQVAHADLASATWTVLAPTLVRRLAGVLPADVRVRSADTAPPGFDARFAALWRSYEYRLTDAPAGSDPLRRHDTVAVPFVSRRLDENAMQTAATGLLGVHDFAGYCRYRVNATTVRGLQELTVARHDDVITITARADAFCHSMVRSLAGALVAVGTGRRPPPWPAELLGLTSRSSAVTVAPAHGLTLVAVGYPPDQDLAARTAITRNLRARPSP